MTDEEHKKSDLLSAVEEWLDRALLGEADSLTLTVIENGDEEITINMTEGFASEPDEDLLPN